MADMRLESILEIAVLVVTVAAFVYSWIYYFRKVAKSGAGWRKWMTLASLVLVSLSILAWPVMVFSMPHANWATGDGVGQQVAHAAFWIKASVRTCTVALFLCLFGKPRLILPIAISCLGVLFFWILNIP
jgi:hypothetical protein